ncbi:DUF2794 domain-containing protein [Yunchengibacter salinarum]|uniref:DUF2794 domain-containing protein n=1 Tax=Yunchengibacter salinarum TaxID=3133399 RepID=UPI0035B5E3AA
MSGSRPIPLDTAAYDRQSRFVVFTRAELMDILNVYGRMVAAGQWRDYAIDHGRDSAQFAIFQRASERPLYRIVKEPALRNRQGQWRLVGQAGQILARGHRLPGLLQRLTARHLKVIDH